MSSSTVHIIDNGTSYTVTTGENVVIGHGDTMVDAFSRAEAFLHYRRNAVTSRSDSSAVEYLQAVRAIPGRTPDES